ncbi:hypothetical protein [Streptomyces caeruleatus]|uniref:Uncharacterized protein n=1 Tax=Streptomyces caeruleatus TaxID=661399 RepID=A0A117RR38_9ACTN|nr:hypothetical protein [Streptomyces caeruleatus]KUO04624.1 hypothetical protein AQJ67_10510 [Streptomyces caeruleatus]
MHFLDLPDVFIGSTDDAHTFVVLNRPLRGADRLLTDAGFTVREVNGRTVYLLPPGTAQEAHDRAGTAMHGLLARTHDLVDLSWTTRWSPKGPLPDPDLRFTFTDATVTASAATPEARSLLEQHGFTPSADASSYRPPERRKDHALLGTVVRAEIHAYVQGLGVRVELGIPTPDAIPAPTHRARSAVPAAPGARQAPRRSH